MGQALVGEESALIVVVPEAEAAVGDWRLRFDPFAAAGEPAHITILYPFLPPGQIGESVLSELAAIFAASPPIRFVLSRLLHFEGVIYLAPEPDEQFRRLIEEVSGRYPDFPPYGGMVPPEEIVPHLTVAYKGPHLPSDLEARLTECLPIEAYACDVRLIIRGTDGFWGTARHFPLRECEV